MMKENINKNKGKTWTPKEIRAYMKSFVNNSMDENDKMIIGDTVNTIPISVDGRLKRSMGYFVGKYKRSGEFVEPMKFKFAKRINCFDDNTIKHIINHELLHLLSDKKYGRNTAHGEEWKECCNKYNVNNNEFLFLIQNLKKNFIDIIYIALDVKNQFQLGIGYPKGK